MLLLAERLTQPLPLLLDGATGTELSRRGVNLNVPSWTAGVLRDQPQVLSQIHRDYVSAGAEMITANTFRTHARNLRSLGLEPKARELTLRAVEIARAAAGRHVYVAGSVAPLEDCYSPHLTPDDAELLSEHRQMAEFLAAAGVDFILVETQLTIREARIAAQAARETGLPFGVSFVCNRLGQLLSGESLRDAFHAISAEQPLLLLVNCIPVEEVLSSLAAARGSVPGIATGAYANTGRLLPNGTWESTSGEKSAVYAEHVKAWIDAGLRLVGGCCGTTPSHISAIRRMVYGLSSEAGSSPM